MSERTGIESETGAMEYIYEGAKGRYSPLTDSLKLPEELRAFHAVRSATRPMG